MADDRIDSYRRAATNMQDTTRWLMALLPVAATAAALAAVVSPLAQRGHLGWPGIAAIALLTVAAIALGALARLAASVISVSVPGWGDAVREAAMIAGPAGPLPGSLAADLDEDGVLRLYGYERAAELFAEVAGRRARGELTIAAGVLVVEYATYRRVRRCFIRFLRRGSGALALSIVCLLTAGGLAKMTITRPPLPSITEPTAVYLEPTTITAQELRAAYGCTATTELIAWAVGGNIEAPRMILADPRCVPGKLDWTTEDGVVVPLGCSTRPGC